MEKEKNNFGKMLKKTSFVKASSPNETKIMRLRAKLERIEEEQQRIMEKFEFEKQKILQEIERLEHHDSIRSSKGHMQAFRSTEGGSGGFAAYREEEEDHSNSDDNPNFFQPGEY